MSTLEQAKRVFHAATPEPQLEVVCCWCVPHHVIQVGVQPTSHGACPLGVATFETGGRS